MFIVLGTTFICTITYLHVSDSFIYLLNKLGLRRGAYLLGRALKREDEQFVGDGFIREVINTFSNNIVILGNKNFLTL